MTAPGILTTDPKLSAAVAGLRYLKDGGPGIRRVRAGKGFRYVDPEGRPVRDAETLERVRALAIPPAWANVWICPTPYGHIQAVGWDVKGRKQYRYHPLYRKVRDESKFGRMIAFGAVLAVIRRRVNEDLDRRGLPREKVLAAVVRLLDATYMRVGNYEYARDNESFGLTTLRDKHARISGATLALHFRGKSGQEHAVELTDERLARIVRRCQELPGYELFQYVDKNGVAWKVDSGDVNAYLREITGHDFSAKDFRTWAGTLLAARELTLQGPCRSDREGKKKILEAVRGVARRLGNRPATCRKYYVHPAIVEAYAEGSLFPVMREGLAQERAYNGRGLLPEEYAVLTTVAEYQEKQVRQARGVMRGRRVAAA